MWLSITGERLPGRRGAIVGSLRSYFALNGQSDYVNCGTTRRCGGGEAPVCVMKISDQGTYLPVKDLGPLHFSARETSSVELFPETGHLRLMDAPEVYNSLTKVPVTDYGATQSYISYSRQKNAGAMSCSVLGMTGGGVDQQCDFQLGATLVAGQKIGIGLQAVQTTMAGPFMLGYLGGPPAPASPMVNNTTSKATGLATSGFVCPAGAACDTPHLSPGDPGYAALK